MNHPITDLPFDYEHVCKTCAHFTDKTRTVRKVAFRTTRCALDPDDRNLADIPGTVWTALPACAKHRPRDAKKPGDHHGHRASR